MDTEEFTFKSVINSLMIPTLEEITTVAIAIQLLEDEEVKKIYCEHFSVKWPEDKLSESSVRELTSVCKSIQLPDILQDKIVKCFHWIREQYFKWIYYVDKNLSKLQEIFPTKIDYITHVLNSVKWSMGAIDTEKSFHQIFLLENIKDDAVLGNMFVIASRYCLEDKLKILWKKMSTCRKKKLVADCKARDYYVYYWTCKMSEDMREFLKDISSYLKKCEYLDADMDIKDPYNYAFVLHIFKGDISGVKHFNKLANIDVEDMVHIIRKFLKELDHKGYPSYCGWEEFYWCPEKIHLLLHKIEDESILKEIFNEFFKVFLVMSVLRWPWRKFFSRFIGVWHDNIDEVLIYDLITQLVENVKMKKVDIWEVKMFFKKLSNKLKKLFCTFMSNKQNKRDFKCLWRNMTIEVFDIFLKDEELSNILTVHENQHVLYCVQAEQYDLVDYWLQKCLVSEEAIISYFENFIHSESVKVINDLDYDEISNLTHFLEWAFKYEDLMNRDKILEIKDEIIDDNFFYLFVDNFGDEKNWNDLKKLMDWMLRNRNHEYENELFNWKREVTEQLMRRCRCTFSNDFKNSLCAFLSYGVNDFRKIKAMMRKADVNEGYICFQYLTSDFALIDRYLRLLEGFGRDICLTKKNIFHYVFKYPAENQFEDETYWINIRKLFYWNIKSNKEKKTKLDEIKKAIINKFAFKWILICVRKKEEVIYLPYRNRAIATTRSGSNGTSNVGMNSILEFLFENKMEDKEWSIILSGLKMKVIEELRCDDLWKGENCNNKIISLINWGEENENIRNGNWDVKKYFIEWLKKNIKVEIIPKLILHASFVSSLLKGDKARPDYENTLWDLTQFLVNKVISDDNDMLTIQLPENLIDFLNRNCSNEARLHDLKIKIFVRLFQIKTDKHSILSDFFDRCISKNTYWDLNSVILNFKKGVLDMIFSEYSKDWDEIYFKRLSKFLSLHSTGDEKDLKKTAVEKYGAKSCCQCFIDRNLIGLKAFMKWADIKDKESIKNFKRNILIEFLDPKYDNCWKDQEFWLDIHNFLCDHDNRGFVELASIKLDILEIYFFPVFVKLLAEKNRHKLKGFLKWISDRSMKSSGCVPRAQKLVREMFETCGRDYCILMLMEDDLDGVTDFWNLSFDSKIGIKINKSLLWNFKKDCIDQLLTNEIEKTVEGKNDWNSSLENFWNCLNKFISSGSGSSSLKTEIFEYKDFVLQKYGILYMEKYFKCLLKNASLKIPENFLKWLFGSKNRNSKTDLNEEKLFDFKRRVLEMLVSVKHKDLWEKDYFYKVLDQFLKLNLTPSNLNVTYNLKKGVCEVQGVELCYSWIHNSQWNEMSLFLEWSFEKADYWKLKLEIIRKHGAEYCNGRILDDDWLKLEKFLKWAFDFHENNIEREEDIINLKTKTLNSEICYKYHSEIVLSFLEWGFTSKANLNKFKKSILGKSHPLNFFVTKQKYKTKKQFQLWFGNKNYCRDGELSTTRGGSVPYENCILI